MKKILVTGGAGFLGSHLCEKLIKQGHRVVCMDNFSTGKAANIKELRKNEKFSLLEWNIIDPFQLWVDEIYNLACPASPIQYQKNPIDTVKTTVLGVMNLLELARKQNIKILQASTSEIYGDPLEHPQTEEYYGNVNVTGIRSCYDEGKRCAETLFYDYHRYYHLNIKIVRIFNTYGPNMSKYDGRVVSNFIVQSLKDKSITIYGKGTQTRSFCYVDDTIDGLIKMMNSKDEITGPINIGNPKETSIKDLAKKIIKKTHSNCLIRNNELPKDDPVRRKPSIELAKKHLNWEPKIDLNKGLDKTIKYFKHKLKNEKGGI